MRNARIFLLLSMMLMAPAVSSAFTEEENQKLLDEAKEYQFKKVTTPEGLNFTIPADMPIETRNGIKGPIPFEEYLYIRFQKLEEKINVIDKKIDELRAVFAATQKAASEKKLSPQEQAGLLSSS